MPIQLESTYSAIDPRLFKHCSATSMPMVKEIVFNDDLSHDLSLLDLKNDQDRSLYLSGQKPIGPSKPFAQAYAGHQFGHFTNLGDGRALVLGEFFDANHNKYDLQLKGSGPTPYSRRGDGMATTAAMLREYLMSECMHGLGIPTSRSLSVYATGLYVDRGKEIDGAVLARIAKSHIRVGTFEFIASHQDLDLLRKFTAYTIDRHYPTPGLGQQSVKAFLEHVMEAQISLIIHWLRVGFVHGVMNTDNMSIAGETIDYGPCAFINEFDWGAVYSSIDTQGRYSFGRQAPIAQWNLACLASALLPILDPDQAQAEQIAQKVIDSFVVKFEEAYLHMMRKKLGIPFAVEGDVQLITTLTSWMQNEKADYTGTFWAFDSIENAKDPLFFTDKFREMQDALQRLHADGKFSKSQCEHLMHTNNPQFIPRNEWVEKALVDASEQKDFTFFNKILAAGKNPYIRKKGLDELYDVPKSNPNYKTYCGT